VDPRLFGGFLEHLGRAVYEGVYDSGSVHADEDGFRIDTLDALRRLKMPVMRYPGGNGLTARYLISLPRAAPLAGYQLVQRLFDENPDLIPTIVGLDFCFFEEGYSPETVRPFFTQLHKDNRDRPHRALEVAYHVGESYFDKSLESAIRWCHEVAEMGACRMGHAIALGLDLDARALVERLGDPRRFRLGQIRNGKRQR